MDLKEKNITIKNELDLIVKEQEIINIDHIARLDYLTFLLDQLLLEYIENKDIKNNDLQLSDIVKTKYIKKPIFLYLLINFYIALVLLTFVFFFIIDPFKIIHN